LKKKKKTFKKFSKFQFNSAFKNADHKPKVVKSSTTFDNLPLPTQQLVSSFLPWYEVLANEPTGAIDDSFHFVDDMKVYSKKLLEIESSLYQGSNKKLKKDTNSSSWVKTAATAGMKI